MHDSYITRTLQAHNTKRFTLTFSYCYYSTQHTNGHVKVHRKPGSFLLHNERLTSMTTSTLKLRL
jgi:hypothetical protein